MSKLLKSLNLVAVIFGVVLFVLSLSHTAKAQGCQSMVCETLCIYGFNCTGCHDGGTICTVYWGAAYGEGGGGTCLNGLWCWHEFCADVCMEGGGN